MQDEVEKAACLPALLSLLEEGSQDEKLGAVGCLAQLLPAAGGPGAVMVMEQVSLSFVSHKPPFEIRCLRNHTECSKEVWYLCNLVSNFASVSACALCALHRPVPVSPHRQTRVIAKSAYQGALWRASTP